MNLEIKQIKLKVKLKLKQIEEQIKYIALEYIKWN